MATVAITGAARGIGLELVKQHLAAGDRILALIRTPSSALSDLAAESKGTLTLHTMDVGDPASVKAGAASTGDDPVDIVYNVAGVSGPTAPELESADWAAWDDVLSVMLKGPLCVLQAFLPRLGGGSKVINITSQIGASTWPYGGYYAYAAAKAGLNRMMRSVAIDLRDHGIIIALIHPGYVQTDMGGPNAEITPLESAQGIHRLARDWTLDQSGDFYNWNGTPHAW